MSARRIGVVTVGRSDFGIYRPVLEVLAAAPGLEYGLYVSGMHLSPDFGLTVREIEDAGEPIIDRIEMLEPADDPASIAASMARGTAGFGRAFDADRPDLLLVLGDRFEMHAAVVAAVPFLIPVAHIHGGEITAGAFDNMLRHSITTLSHLHFASTETAARRIRGLGAAPDRVIVSGAPALDRLRRFTPIDRAALEIEYGLPAGKPFLLAALHPATLEPERAEEHARALIAALDAVRLPVVFTGPNADPGGRAIRRILDEFVAGRDDSHLFDHLPADAWFSLMRVAAALVGNSSGGIIEAASFELPVVNVGTRQDGRERSQNVIDVPAEAGAIEKAIRRAVSKEFRASLRGMRNVYGDGHAASRIVAVLGSVPLGDALRRPRLVPT